MSAYFPRNVVPQWSLLTIYRCMVSLMVIQLLCLVSLSIWPGIMLWLPRQRR